MSIKTWQTRWEIGLHKDDAMQAEIDELREELAKLKTLTSIQQGQLDADDLLLKERDAELAMLKTVLKQALEAMQENWKTDKSEKAIEAIQGLTA